MCRQEPLRGEEPLRRQAALAALVLALAGCGDTEPAVEPFLDAHWARPLAPQGQLPASVFPAGEPLAPQSCGTCHAAQFEGWRRSRHARAMSPGVLGQLASLDAAARDEHQDCLRCHAPLAEQADALAAALAAGGDDLTGEKRGPTGALFRHGLTCAGCHVRGWQIYGPPRRGGSRSAPDARLPHGGWQSSAAFQDSRFCASCHQFTPDQLALNGKPIENTYEEWKASAYGREGRTCQSCHMPERRHLWRGIYDPDMTRSGVTIRASATRAEDGVASGELRVRNTGTGHHFPTYVTPRIVVEGFQQDAKGVLLAGTRQIHVIGRQVKLDLSEELADTRLAPGEEALFRYRQPKHPAARALELRVRVEPDAFYTGFYRSLLASGGAGKGERMIRRALDESLASAYTLFSERAQLKGSHATETRPSP